LHTKTPRFFVGFVFADESQRNAAAVKNGCQATKVPSPVALRRWLRVASSLPNLFHLSFDSNVPMIVR
jgi:hypothetical protein